MLAKIKLPKDFKKGQCKNCPFNIGAYQDEVGGWGYYTYCLFEYEQEPDILCENTLEECDTCKLEIEESEEEE